MVDKAISAGAVAITAMTVLTGCSGQPKSQPATPSDSASTVSQHSATPKPTVGPSATSIRAYVSAIASQAVPKMRAAQRAAADGSLAEAYAMNQADQEEANLAGGFDPSKAGQISQHGSGYRICFPDSKGKTTCYQYAHFKVTKAGDLASFTVDGRSLHGRLLVGDSTSVKTPLANVRLRSAYVTQAGSLVVECDVKTKDRGIDFDAASTYKAPSGRITAMNGSTGPSEVTSHSLASELFYFNGSVKLGGTVQLKMFNSSGSFADATALIALH